MLNKGWNILVKYAGKKLSFTDCTTIEYGWQGYRIPVLMADLMGLWKGLWNEF